MKHIAYLYVYCNTHPRDIRSRYSRVLTDAHVHFALAHYYSNRKLFDAQIAEDRMLHAHDALSRYGRLPAVGVGAILEAAEIEARPPAEKKSTLAEG